MDDNFDDVAINTFKNSLSVEYSLRKSLIGKLATSVRQLMDRIDKYKWVEEDQLQGKGKGKEKVIPQERKDFRSDRYNSNRPRRDFVGQSRATNAQTIMLCSENQYIGCWRKSRTNHTLSGRIRWQGNPRGAIRTFIANTTRTTDIPRRTAGTSGITWTS